MNLDRIQQILKFRGLVDDSLLRSQIISVISQDENVLIDMMEILNQERKNKKETINELNLNLSRSVFFLTRSRRKKKDINFTLEELAKMREKTGIVSCFANEKTKID